MHRQFTQSKRFTHNSISGFALSELLVAILIGLLVLGVALQLSAYDRKLYLQDQVRQVVNQNLRAAMDSIGIDTRQAGEQITDSLFPVITLQRNNNLSELFIRRSLLGTALPVCKPISAGSNTDVVFIAVNAANPPAGCAPQTNNPDGWPANLDIWRNYRLSQPGGSVNAYIYDGNGNGEFFTYDAEDNSNFKIHKANATHWQNSYSASNSSVYLLEERHYRLCYPIPQSQLSQITCTNPANGKDILQLVIDGNNYINLVNAMTDFQIQILMQDGTVKNTFGSTDRWTQIKAIQVDITSTDLGNNMITTKADQSRRHFSQVFFPRNVTSK